MRKLRKLRKGSKAPFEAGRKRRISQESVRNKNCRSEIKNLRGRCFGEGISALV